MKYFFLTASVLFLLFAFVQFNDPDPILWIAVYLLTSILCFLASRGRYYPPLAALIAIVYLGWAIYLLPIRLEAWWQLENSSRSFEMKMPGVEASRESIGLILAGIMLVIICFRGIRLKKKIT